MLVLNVFPIYESFRWFGKSIDYESFIDSALENVVYYECDGGLILIWKNDVPDLFSTGQSVAATNADDTFSHEYIFYWHINHSITSKAIENKAKVNGLVLRSGFSMN